MDFDRRRYRACLTVKHVHHELKTRRLAEHISALYYKYYVII
jgi:hypothetical protein